MFYFRELLISKRSKTSTVLNEKERLSIVACNVLLYTNELDERLKHGLTLSLPVTRICVNYSTVYNDTLVAKGLISKLPFSVSVCFRMKIIPKASGIVLVLIIPFEVWIIKYCHQPAKANAECERKQQNQYANPEYRQCRLNGLLQLFILPFRHAGVDLCKYQRQTSLHDWMQQKAWGLDFEINTYNS